MRIIGTEIWTEVPIKQDPNLTARALGIGLGWVRLQLFYLSSEQSFALRI